MSDVVAVREGHLGVDTNDGDERNELFVDLEFERRLRECVERYQHLQRPATLLLIELHRFKAVDDTGGHAAGDEVLRQVAQTLRRLKKCGPIGPWKPES